MEYRQLPHGNENEKFGVLGLGMGGIQHTPADEIEAIIRKAIDNGINFFDLCAGDTLDGGIGIAQLLTFNIKLIGNVSHNFLFVVHKVLYLVDKPFVNSGNGIDLFYSYTSLQSLEHSEQTHVINIVKLCSYILNLIE